MKKIKLNKDYIEAIERYDENYRFSLEYRYNDAGDSDYIDCDKAKDVIKELKAFVKSENFNPQDYECLAVLIYEAHSEYDFEDEDEWGERVDEYYFI